MAEDVTPRRGFGATFWAPLSEEEFMALGIIAALFGQIETQVDRLIQALAGVASRDDLEMLYDGKQFGSKVSLLRKLAKTKASDPAKTEILAACKLLDEVAAARNQAIHGQWGSIEAPGTPEHGLVVAMSARAPNKFLRADGLIALVAEIEKAAYQVHLAVVAFFPKINTGGLPWRHAFQAEPPPSRPKSQPPSRPPSPSPGGKK
jgi:hypothetical protein